MLITSPRTNLKENWRKELEKWGLLRWAGDLWIVDAKRAMVEIIIENVQTAYKWKDREFDFIIADEIHTMMTPEYSAVLELKTQRLMGLTATHDITDNNDKGEYYEKYCPIIYEYYESADDGLINKTRFFIVNHILDNETQVRIDSKKGVFMRGEADQYEYLSERIKKGQQMMLMQGSQSWFQDAADWF